MFDDLQNLPFNVNDIPSFITSAKICIHRLYEVGINLPPDIVAYMLLHKLPPSFRVVKEQITHSSVISPDLVLDHLQISANKRRIKEEGKVQLTALCTNRGPLPRCTGGKHNNLAPHSPANCWALHPELRDAYLKKKNKDKSSISRSDK